MKKVIDDFFLWMADALGTDGCIMLFCLIAFVPFFHQLPKSILEWQQWLSQTAIQLIALAVLAKVSKIEGARNFSLLKDTHDVVMEELTQIKEFCSGCLYAARKEHK